MQVANIERFSEPSYTIKTVDRSIPLLVPRHPIVTNDKQRIKCLKQIEQKVRSCMEYPDLIAYLRTYMHMDECAFFPNFKTGKRKGSIEIHHSPFDLFTLAGIVMRKFEAKNDYINQNLIADEIMELHYSGMVGLIPLAVTVHQLVHAGKLSVPLNCVYGKFIKFTQDYYEWLDEPGDDTNLKILEENINLTKNLKPEDMSILNVQYIYTHVEGMSAPDMIDPESVTEVAIREDMAEENIA